MWIIPCEINVLFHKTVYRDFSIDSSLSTIESIYTRVSAIKVIKFICFNVTYVFFFLTVDRRYVRACEVHTEDLRFCSLEMRMRASIHSKKQTDRLHFAKASRSAIVRYRFFPISHLRLPDAHVFTKNLRITVFSNGHKCMNWSAEQKIIFASRLYVVVQY